MKSPQFKHDLLTYLQSLEDAQGQQIEEDTDLIESGVVNSFAIVDLVLFIEERLDIRIDMEDPLLDSVRSVWAMNATYNV